MFKWILIFALGLLSFSPFLLQKNEITFCKPPSPKGEVNCRTIVMSGKQFAARRPPAEVLQMLIPLRSIKNVPCDGTTAFDINGNVISTRVVNSIACDEAGFEIRPFTPFQVARCFREFDNFLNVAPNRENSQPYPGNHKLIHCVTHKQIDHENRDGCGNLRFDEDTIMKPVKLNFMDPKAETLSSRYVCCYDYGDEPSLQYCHMQSPTQTFHACFHNAKNDEPNCSSTPNTNRTEATTAIPVTSSTTARSQTTIPTTSTSPTTIPTTATSSITIPTIATSPTTIPTTATSPTTIPTTVTSSTTIPTTATSPTTIPTTETSPTTIPTTATSPTTIPTTATSPTTIPTTETSSTTIPTTETSSTTMPTTATSPTTIPTTARISNENTSCKTTWNGESTEGNVLIAVRTVCDRHERLLLPYAEGTSNCAVDSDGKPYSHLRETLRSCNDRRVYTRDECGNINFLYQLKSFIALKFIKDTRITFLCVSCYNYSVTNNDKSIKYCHMQSTQQAMNACDGTKVRVEVDTSSGNDQNANDIICQPEIKIERTCEGDRDWYNINEGKSNRIDVINPEACDVHGDKIKTYRTVAGEMTDCFRDLPKNLTNLKGLRHYDHLDKNSKVKSCYRNTKALITTMVRDDCGNLPHADVLPMKQVELRFSKNYTTGRTKDFYISVCCYDYINHRLNYRESSRLCHMESEMQAFASCDKRNEYNNVEKKKILNCK